MRTQYLRYSGIFLLMLALMGQALAAVPMACTMSPSAMAKMMAGMDHGTEMHGMHEQHAGSHVNVSHTDCCKQSHCSALQCFSVAPLADSLQHAPVPARSLAPGDLYRASYPSQFPPSLYRPPIFG